MKMNKLFYPILTIFFLLAVSAACSPAAETVVVTETATVVPSETPSPTKTEEPTATLTSTSLPSPTPTATEEPTLVWLWDEESGVTQELLWQKIQDFQEDQPMTERDITEGAICSFFGNPNDIESISIEDLAPEEGGVQPLVWTRVVTSDNQGIFYNKNLELVWADWDKLIIVKGWNAYQKFDTKEEMEEEIKREIETKAIIGIVVGYASDWQIVSNGTEASYDEQVVRYLVPMAGKDFSRTQIGDKWEEMLAEFPDYDEEIMETFYQTRNWTLLPKIISITSPIAARRTIY